MGVTATAAVCVEGGRDRWKWVVFSGNDNSCK